MFCKKCGAEVLEGASFCLKCGAKIDNASKGSVNSDPFTSRNVGASNINSDSASPSSSSDNKKGLIIAASVILAAIVILLILLFFVIPAINRNDPKTSDNETAESKDPSGSDTDSQSTVLDLLTVKVVSGSDSSPVKDATVTIKGDGFEESAKCDNGLAFFSGIAGGDCTILCEAEDYNAIEVCASLDTDDKELTVPVIPVLYGDDTYVVLAWDSDMDLDLCAFNADLGEYINPGHKGDRDGNISLHIGPGQGVQYEILYIKDSRFENPVTVYVADGENAKEGKSSEMEAGGFDLAVFNRNGLAHSFEPDKSQSASLISVCDISSVSVNTSALYIDDLTTEEYKWLSYSEEDSVIINPDEWKSAYLDVITNDPDDLLDCLIYPGSLNYGLLYINNDDIPELVVTRRNDNVDFPEVIDIYTYSDGAAERLTNSHDDYSFGANLYYFEKQDYIKVNETHEGDMNAWIIDLVPVFDSGAHAYKYKGADDDEYDLHYNEWTMDGKSVSSSDYEDFESSLGQARNIEDECISYTAMIALLSDGDNIPKETWKSPYKFFVFNNYNYWYPEDRFLLVCIDEDDQPELVVFNINTTDVYGWDGNDVKLIHSYENMGAHGIDNSFYEKTGYVVRSGASDSDAVYGYCALFTILEPVFDKGRSTYEKREYAVGYNESTHEYDLATDYSKDGKSITESKYSSETSQITSSSLKTYSDGLARDEFIDKL